MDIIPVLSSYNYTYKFLIRSSTNSYMNVWASISKIIYKAVDWAQAP